MVAAAVVAAGVSLFFGGSAQAAVSARSGHAAASGQDVDDALRAMVVQVQDILATIPGATSAVSGGVSGPQQPAGLMRGAGVAVEDVAGPAGAAADEAAAAAGPAVRKVGDTAQQTLPVAASLGLGDVTPVADAVTPLVADLAAEQAGPVVGAAGAALLN
jgi:hypothetical protein